MGKDEPLEHFRAYYTRSKAAGDHDKAIELSQAETGLYTAVREAFYAGWQARGKVPPPPVEVPGEVRDALAVLQDHIGTGQMPDLTIRAVAAGLGARPLHVEVAEPLAPLPHKGINPYDLPIPPPIDWSKATIRPPVHLASQFPAGPPPVTRLSDYRTVGPANCPTCQSADCDTRLGVWSDYAGKNVPCASPWHLTSVPPPEMDGRPAECPSCASTVVNEIGLVPSGATGRPVSCTDEWHDLEQS